MSERITEIDLSDVYSQNYTEEIETYRQFVSIFVNQIFDRHYVKTGLIQENSFEQLTHIDFHPSLTAYHFTRKLLEYFIDQGNLSIAENGFISLDRPVVDEDPNDEKLNQFLEENPDRKNFFGILRQIRDIIDEVIFKGEDALLTLANDNFREAMRLWEDLMVNARVKLPCHQLVFRALREKIDQDGKITVFEGGAGVGSILRDGLNEPDFLSYLEKIDQYYFTDISLSLIKIGRENLREQLPSNVFDRFQFKVANLDKLTLNGEPYTEESSVDVILLEHVLYDVIDLNATLELFHKILKPGGFLIFTMAYRTPPKTFFLFEYLQSTFQSYNKAKLEKGFRENIGYLTLPEWENSLKRAGFENYEVYPKAEDQLVWPYGGIVATPSK